MRAGAAAAALLLLAACQSLPPVPEAARERAWRGHAARLAALEAWTLVGRMTAQADGRSLSASLRWHHGVGGDAIVLTAPLGGGALRIELDAAGVRLVASDGGERRAADAAALLAAELGVAVPVEALRYWVVGLPQPGAAARRELDREGRLRRLRQGGWEVEYRGYEAAGPWILPRVLFARGGEAEVRIAVERWRPGEAG
ncbi:lipoprotein insertase outer membrane protein LolB [Inmirania thermothiophila]|uniref:Outer-membrane lipoprotein LolB n=1 Tax=Inmirania thermothiophila TaxID=1750597 RepID=A0A3N1Y7L2_9GAMM|nr:lipoprotein insertase outer membrane protein LolB [Inmirania thermothiophila]ROR34804.1 outer membrane lipoprotein LolB [Inmirania thermothiophila]